MMCIYIYYILYYISVSPSLNNPPFEIPFVIPELRSFHDCHKVYGRLEAMKVAKEQALNDRLANQQGDFLDSNIEEITGPVQWFFNCFQRFSILISLYF